MNYHYDRPSDKVPGLKKSTASELREIIQIHAASGRVAFTKHAEERMIEREISRKLVFDALQSGRITLPPEPNLAKGSTEVRLGHYSAWIRYAVVVAIPDAQDKSL